MSPTPSDSTHDVIQDAVYAAVDIAAPPEQVFDALTDPEQLAAWWDEGAAADAPSEWEADPRPGGQWSVRTTDAAGNEATVYGEYVAVDPPRRLEYTWRASWDDFAVTTVRYDLAPAIVHGVPGTRLTVTHTNAGAVAAARVIRSLTATLRARPRVLVTA